MFCSHSSTLIASKYANSLIPVVIFLYQFPVVMYFSISFRVALLPFARLRQSHWIKLKKIWAKRSVPNPKAPLRLRDFLSRWCRRNVIHCRTRYSVAIDAIIASDNARVLLNQGGIGMPYVRKSCPQTHNSAARREKNRSQSDSCDSRGGIAGWRGSAPRYLQHLVENQLNRLKRAAQRYRLPRRGTENRANRNGALQHKAKQSCVHNCWDVHTVDSCMNWTLTHGDAFFISGPLWRESTGHRWIPLIKGR